jgi:hypothetical protein
MKKFELIRERESRETWGEFEFPMDLDNVNLRKEFRVNDNSIQSLESDRKFHNPDITNEYSIDNSATPLQSQRNILSHNSLIDSLKESIKSNVMSIKKYKDKSKLNQEQTRDLFREENMNKREKVKTEKEKIMEHYKSN